jgi:hypothetical protein
MFLIGNAKFAYGAISYFEKEKKRSGKKETICRCVNAAVRFIHRCIPGSDLFSCGRTEFLPPQLLLRLELPRGTVEEGNKRDDLYK